jgi:hypothetical protein
MRVTRLATLELRAPLEIGLRPNLRLGDSGEVVAQLVDHLADTFSTDDDPFVGLDHAAQAASRGVDGGVRIATKRARDFGIAVGGEFARQMGHQTSGDHGSRVPPASEEIFARHPQPLAHALDDSTQTNGLRSEGKRGLVPEKPFDRTGADLTANAFKFDHRTEPRDRAFNLSNRTGATPRNRVFRRRRQIESALARKPLHKRHARGAVGALKFDDHARQETTDKRLAEASNVAGVFVRHKRDARAGQIDGVDRVQKLSLRCRLVGEEVDVVDREEVDPPKSLAEVVEVAGANRGDVLVCELLRGHVANRTPRRALKPSTADSLEEMRLSDPTVAVQENDRRRISGARTELLTCRERHPIRIADHEVF